MKKLNIQSVLDWAWSHYPLEFSGAIKMLLSGGVSRPTLLQLSRVLISLLRSRKKLSASQSTHRPLIVEMGTSLLLSILYFSLFSLPDSPKSDPLHDASLGLFDYICEDLVGVIESINPFVSPLIFWTYSKASW